MDNNSNYDNVKSVNRLLDILEFYSNEDGKVEFGISDLSRKLDLNKSTTHRYLSCLEKRGYMVKNKDNAKYRLGSKFIRLGSIVLDNLVIQNEATEIMEQLANKVKKTVHMAILHNSEVMYIHKVENPESVVRYSKIGRTAPLYCTAMGKVLLSGYSNEKLNSILNNINFKHLTSNTITNKDDLIKEIREINNKGYAIDNEELELGLYCISSPIVNHKGKTVAALSISGGVTTFDNTDYIGPLQESVKAVSKRIGHQYNSQAKL